MGKRVDLPGGENTECKREQAWCLGEFQVCVTDIRCPCREEEVVVWPLAGVNLNLMYSAMELGLYLLTENL